MITGIVLGAGRSSRMGRPKQLLPLGGRPVLQHVLDAAEAAALDEVLLVLGHRADEVRRAVRLTRRARVVVNEDYEEGQSTSLRAGLWAASEESEAAVVLLGDQPGIRAQAIASVVAAFREGRGPVLQATYGGRPAHPVLFARSVWSELEQARGDEGARGIIAGHADWPDPVEVGGLPPDDIDTETDYLRVRAAFEAGPGPPANP